MSKTHYIERPCFSLKDAYTRLIEAAGGAVAVADYVRVSSSQLHRYTDPALDDCHMPADIVMVLERFTSQPLVTRFNVQKLGYEMHPIKVDHTEALPILTAQLGHEMAELSGAVLEAAGDGVITKDEALRIAKEAADVQEKATNIIAEADRLAEIDTEPATPKQTLTAVS